MRGPASNRKGRNGQAVLLTLVGLSVFMVGALGLALDGSQLFAHWQMAQSAADAAAQSAALSIYHGTNVTGTYPFATATPVSPFTCTTTDGRTPCAYARLNGFGGTSADTVTVSFPTTLAGVSNLSTNSVPVVTVAITRNVTTWLMPFLGTRASNITATGTAALLQTPLLNCITSLSHSGTGFSVTGNATITLSSCGIDDNSNMSLTGNINVTASGINVAGSYQGTGNISVSPTPVTQAPVVGDPLASVPEPTYNAASSCNYTGLSYTGNVTPVLSAGTYCGGLSITGNAQVTFTGGTYIFRGGLSITGNASVTFGAGTYILQGGGLTATGNVTLTGSGVTFYNTFDASDPYAPVSLTGNIIANLSAPTSGPQEGMLFFQDRNAPTGNTETITGNSNMNLTGAIYFPNSTLSYTGNTSGSGSDVALIADYVILTGNASFKESNIPGSAVQPSVALVN